MTTIALMFAFSAQTNTTMATSLERDAFSQALTFSIPKLGSTTLYLPSDIRHGDTITGTVITFPEGRNAAAKAKNEDTLSGYVIEIEGKKSNANGVLRFMISAPSPLRMNVLDKSGKVVASQELECLPTIENPWHSFDIPRIGQAGRPIEINGQFDGDIANTQCSLGGQRAAVLAESPRGCIVMVPPNVSAGQMTILENGKSFSAPFNSLSVQLSAPKTTLLKGEQTTVQATVSGFEGLDREAFPIPFELTNQSPGIIRIQGFQGTSKCFSITPEMVKGNVWTTSMGVTAINAGGFGIRGVLFAVGIHALKKNLDKAGFIALLDAFIAAAEAEVAQINKEEADATAAGKKWPNSPEKTGRKMRRDILKSFIEKMKLARDLAGDDLGIAKVVADKALADKTVLEVGAELIGLAAELLGYTDLPMPGLGTVLKGAKVLTKSAKIIDLIEKAEKALEAYEKASDLKDKAEKLKDLRDALDKAKKGMDEGD